MRGQTGNTSRSFAKHLRKTMTDAERRLGQRLRGQQLGVKFRRQHPFEGYVLDFVCLERGLVVEVDGSQHADSVTHDAMRTDVLERAGFRVMRFWNNEVLAETDAVVESVMRALDPSPPRPGSLRFAPPLWRRRAVLCETPPPPP